MTFISNIIGTTVSINVLVAFDDLLERVVAGNRWNTSMLASSSVSNKRRPTTTHCEDPTPDISIPTKFLSRLVQACTSKKSPKKPESHKLDQLGHIFSQAYSGNSENLVFKN